MEFWFVSNCSIEWVRRGGLSEKDASQSAGQRWCSKGYQIDWQNVQQNLIPWTETENAEANIRGSGWFFRQDESSTLFSPIKPRLLFFPYEFTVRDGSPSEGEYNGSWTSVLAEAAIEATRGPGRDISSRPELMIQLCH
jgi:hypothetical protein